MRNAADKDAAYREGIESRAGTKVFTDGLDVKGGVGAAAILFKDGQRRGTLRFHLGASSSHTVYEAELVGITLAAHLLKAERCGQVAKIGVDSQAAMDALNLNRPAPSHYLVDEARKLLNAVKVQHPATKLLVRWIPGHMGIEGNEMADSEAKKAAMGSGSPPHTLPSFLRNPLPASSSATKRAFNESIKHDAAEFLAKSKCYSQLRTIDASVPSVRFCKLTAELTRKQASLLVQLRTGHIPLNHHLAQIGTVQSPLYPACREREETVHHFLLGCTAYASQHQELYAKLSRDAYSIPHLLAHPKALAPLFHCISATR